MSRIALIGENSIEYINILIDIWNSGACAVLIDWRVPIKTAYKMMIEADVTNCYMDEKLSEKFSKSDFPNINFIEYVSSRICTISVPRSVYNRFQENYSRNEAVVIYSSGTTGVSKGIILSHYAISTNADAIQDYMRLSSRDNIYICRSLSHSSTLTGELLVALKYKINLVLSSTIVPPRLALANISQFNVTTLCVNPILLKMYSEENLRKCYNMQSLKAIYVSGSILNDSIYKVSHSAFKGIPIYNVYGLSEAGPRVTAQTIKTHPGNSVGKPLKGVEIVIVDNWGQVLPENLKGIIHIKSTSMYSGYISGNKKYQSLYKDWFNTGDIGFIDSYGDLHVVDRVDDVIIIDSHKIYPSDIEKLILLYPQIEECVVSKININSNSILACLYVGSTVNVNGLRKYLSSLLPIFEIPKIFIMTNVIPKTLTGKIVKSEVQKILSLNYNRLCE